MNRYVGPMVVVLLVIFSTACAGDEEVTPAASSVSTTAVSAPTTLPAEDEQSEVAELTTSTEAPTSTEPVTSTSAPTTTLTSELPDDNPLDLPLLVRGDIPGQVESFEPYIDEYPPRLWGFEASTVFEGERLKVSIFPYANWVSESEEEPEDGWWTQGAWDAREKTFTAKDFTLVRTDRTVSYGIDPVTMWIEGGEASVRAKFAKELEAAIERK